MIRTLLDDEQLCRSGRLGWDTAPVTCRAYGFGQVVVQAGAIVIYGTLGSGWTVGPAVPGGAEFAGSPATDLSGGILARGPVHPNPFYYYLSFINAYTTSGTTLTFAGPGTINSHFVDNTAGPPQQPAGNGHAPGFFAMEYMGGTTYVWGYYAVPTAFPLVFSSTAWTTPPDEYYTAWGSFLQGDPAQPWYVTSQPIGGYPFSAPWGGYAGQLYDGGGVIARRWPLVDADPDYYCYLTTGSYLSDTYLWVAGNRSRRDVAPDAWQPRAWEGAGPGTWTEHSPPVAPGSAVTYLTGIHTNSNTDTWAVGWKDPNFTPFVTSESQIYIAHWNGSTWTVLDTPCWVGGSSLDAVHGLGPNDVWAVGREGGYPDPSGFLALHWDGVSWTDHSP